MTRTYEAARRELEETFGELIEAQKGRASQEELSQWADDPVGWDREAGREPVDYQCRVMESYVENKRTTWRGCHGCGKEWTLGSLAVHGAYSRGMLVLVISATEKQVMGQTMPEVHRAWRAARRAHGIGGELYKGSVRVGGEDRIIALTGSANVDALTGWHNGGGDNGGVLVLISEGQGEQLEKAAYDAAEGNVTTSKGRIVAAGNPVRSVGRFYEIHQRDSWTRFRTSAFDTPNIKAGKVVREGFPEPDWADDMASEYTRDSAWYIGRVLAEFPDADADRGLFRRSWIDAAFERHEQGSLQAEAYDNREQYILGVDVARAGGDETVVAIRRGDVLERFESWSGKDTEETADRVHEMAKGMGSVSPFEPSTAAVSEIIVDAGGLGVGVFDKIDKKPGPWKVTDYKGSRAAKKSDRYRNRRAEAYAQLRTRLQEGEIALPRSEKLAEDLMSIRYEEDSRGRLQLEAKRHLTSRLNRSTDRGDAAVMAFGGKTGRERVTEIVRWG